MVRPPLGNPGSATVMGTGSSVPGRSAPRPPQVRSFRPLVMLGRSAPTVRSFRPDVLALHPCSIQEGRLKIYTDINCGMITITLYVNISIPTSNVLDRLDVPANAMLAHIICYP